MRREERKRIEGEVIIGKRGKKEKEMREKEEDFDLLLCASTQFNSATVVALGRLATQSCHTKNQFLLSKFFKN